MEEQRNAISINSSQKQGEQDNRRRGTNKNINHYQVDVQPSLNFQVIANNGQKEEEMDIPDRSLQVTQPQINILVQSGGIYDVNRNPQILNSYIEPPPSNTRKIAFAITNGILAILLFTTLKFQVDNDQQLLWKNNYLKRLTSMFIINGLTIIVNLIFHFIIKPQRIMKYAHYFLLLNVRPMNCCVNVLFGYLICDFGIFFLVISIGFLIINSIKICMQNRRLNKKRNLVEGKGNKLLSHHRNQGLNYSFSNSTQANEYRPETYNKIDSNTGSSSTVNAREVEMK